MHIDWTHFTPWPSLLGGLLLGLAAGAFILLNGRVLGISGILGGLFTPQDGDIAWRFSMLLGLLLAPLVWFAFGGVIPARIDADFGTLVISGLIVGVGTRIGSGCTSGHGVCGLSRLSLRSLVATGAFMFAGFVTVYVVRHALS